MSAPNVPGRWTGPRFVRSAGLIGMNMCPPDINGHRPAMMDDPLVPVDTWRLEALVAKTPLSMPEFERLVGWSFSMGDAPASKRRLAWDILQLPEEDLLLFKLMRQHCPEIWISRASLCGQSSGSE
jgi:hypothetical protein